MARIPTGGDELTAAEEIRVQEIQALADTSAAEALGKSSGSVVKVTRAAALGANDNYVTDAEKVVIGNTSGTNSGDSATPAETATTIGALIGGAGDATPNDTDFVATSLTASGILKKITWTNVKAFLKTYFDTLYSAIVASKIKVYKNTLQSVANGTPVKMQFDTVIFDGLNEWDETTNYRFTASSAGYYQVNWSILLKGLVTGHTVTGNIKVDGTTDYAFAQIYVQTTIDPHIGNSDVIYLAANSYIELYCLHDDTAARNTEPGSQYTYLSIHRLS